MNLTLSQLQAWWDSTMLGLAGKHPRLAFFIDAVKALGDKYIPSVSGSIPSLPSAKALFDWFMAELEAKFPAYALALSVVQGLVDAWLSQAGSLPTP